MPCESCQKSFGWVKIFYDGLKSFRASKGQGKNIADYKIAVTKI